MLNICLDVSAALQQNAGISRYQYNLTKALLDYTGINNYSFFYNATHSVNVPNFVAHLPQKHLVRNNKRWRMEILAGHVLGVNYDRNIFSNLQYKPDLFHGMDYISPPLKTPTLITIFDLTFLNYPQFHSHFNRNYLKLILPLCARKAQKIITISENTRTDLLKWLGEKYSSKIKVTPLGILDETYLEDLKIVEIENTLKHFNLKRDQYLLNVGTFEPRKNKTKLVVAFSQLLKLEAWHNKRLVLVGRAGWGGEYEKVKMVAQHKGLTLSEDDLTSDSQILILTKVEDKQLKTLYQGALATCYVSHYEGFGLPALEAMAAGSPLVVSNNSSLPEITGSDDKAALSVDSTDTSQIVNALQSLIHNPQLRQSLKFEARKRAKPFTWKRTAELTWDVYQEVVKSSRAGER